MSKPVSIAIVGCGTLTGETILPHLSHPDFAPHGRVVAVCDVVRARAEGLAGRFGVPAWYDDYDAMLARSDAEAVLVITPGQAHAAHALAAIRSGRHVYVQKPMARTVAEAQAIVAAARQAKVKLVAAPGQALWPLWAEMRGAMGWADLGPAYMAMPPMLGWPGRTVGFPTHPGHFFAADGGPLHDHGGYGVQTLVALFGGVRRVAAMAANVTPARVWRGHGEFPTPGMDNTAVLLDFGGGMIGMMHDAWCARSRGSSILRVHFLQGAMETSAESANDLALLPYACTVTAGGDMRRLTVDVGAIPWCANGHVALGHVHVYGDILHLVTCIRRGVEPVACGERGVHFVEVLEAAFRAAKTGQTQDLTTTVPAGGAVEW